MSESEVEAPKEQITEPEAQTELVSQEELQRRAELRAKYSGLFRDGKLVQVHVRKWHMSATLTKGDLPLRDGEAPPEFAELGRKRLLPHEELQKFRSCEAKARVFLQHSAHFFPIAQAHFVPSKVLLPVMTRLDEARTEYMGLVDSFVERYEGLKEAYLQKYADQRAKLEPFYPPANEIRGRFSFAVSVFEVAFPENMKATDLALLQAEDAARRELQAQLERQLRQQTDQSMRDIQDFLRNAASAARSEVVQVFEVVAKKLRDGEAITKSSINKMVGIVDAFDGLDFMNDREVKTRLVDLKAMLVNGNRDFRDDRQAIDQLRTAVGDILTVARDISDIDALTGEYQRRIVI